MIELAAHLILITMCLTAISMLGCALYMSITQRRTRTIGWKSTYTYRIVNNHLLRPMPVDINSEDIKEVERRLTEEEIVD